MVNVSFHVEAQTEYDNALAWYIARDSVAADGFEAEVGRATKLLAEFPELGAPCDRRHRYWLLGKFSYGLVYRIEADAIRVVAVPQHHQRPGYWKKRV